MNIELFNDFFKNAPSSIDTEAIRQEWLNASNFYNVDAWQLPLPLWVQRGYENSGDEAWGILCHDLAESSSNAPMSIYLHTPFCNSKCGFCDSYSFKLGSHHDERIHNYVDQLCDELYLWSQQGTLSQRPITTVHIGGGTPTFIGEAELTRLVESCKRFFNILPTTEWALESTAYSLTASMISTMHDLGYRRLHIGVQSLESPVRNAIGRRSSISDLLAKIETTRGLGWVVSVDLLCGLPFQTLQGFLGSLETLIAAGVNGFSLYELLIYPQNRRWAEKHNLIDRSHLPNYLMFLAGAKLLGSYGFGKNLFNHWADPLDANIYFTFPLRGEDLLAVGTIADGVFGDYHYRHPRYTPYLSKSQGGNPGLEGGLRKTLQEKQTQPLIMAILSGQIPSTVLANLDAIADAGSLIEQWLDSGLLELDADDRLHMTDSGSWFAGNMISDVNIKQLTRV